MNILSFLRISLPAVCMLLIASCATKSTSESQLTSTPMLGHVGMRHAVAWSQATDSTPMQLIYWERGKLIPSMKSSYGTQNEYNC